MATYKSLIRKTYDDGTHREYSMYAVKGNGEKLFVGDARSYRMAQVMVKAAVEYLRKKKA